MIFVDCIPRNITRNQGGEEYSTYNKQKKTTWIGNTLLMNSFLKYTIEKNYRSNYRKDEKTKKKT
jgi:hypothetical protein